MMPQWQQLQDAKNVAAGQWTKPQYETDNASIRNDEGSASLVKSVKRCFNLALDTP